MEDRSLAAEWTNQTHLHGVGLAALIVLGVVLLSVPRRYAVLPLAIMACFVASAQRIDVGGLDFDLLRIMTLIGWVRIIARNENRGFTFKPIDFVIIAWALSGTIAFTVLHGSTTALINRLGLMFDALGLYFLFRAVVRDWTDVDRIVQSLMIVSVPVALAFLIERSTGRNFFAFFGGVPETTVVRDGKLRCQGAFSHAILAGCFFAALMPLFAARWWASRRQRGFTIVALAAGLVIVLATNSSTSVMAVAAGVFGGLMYRLRNHVRAIWWTALGIMVAMQLVMKSNVWHLLSRINVISGSTGYHRYKLIDEAVNHLGEWWLIGVKDTSHWFHGLQDITNQFILEGVRGGLLTMLLFVATLVLAFRGLRLRFALVQHDPRLAAYVWAIGVSLFVHCVCFMGVSYFGQIKLLWYLTLAIIGAITPVAFAKQADGKWVSRAGATVARRTVVSNAAAVRRSTRVARPVAATRVGIRAPRRPLRRRP
jgi:hypothetical protein